MILGFYGVDGSHLFPDFAICKKVSTKFLEYLDSQTYELKMAEP